MLATGSAAADTLNTPRCQRDLAMANSLINTIAAREKQFAPGDLAKNCGLLNRTSPTWSRHASRWIAA